MTKQQRNTGERLIFYSIILSAVSQLAWVIGSAFKARDQNELPVGEVKPPGGPQVGNQDGNVSRHNQSRSYFSLD